MKRIIALISALIIGLPAVFGQDADSQYATEMLKRRDKAPETVIPKLDGTPWSVKDLRGKYIVLQFWATWCPDCVAEMPKMAEAYKKYASDRVRFVGVSFDTDREKLENYLKDNGIEWLQVSDLKKKKESPVAEAFQIKWIPAFYLIDPIGRVVLGTVIPEKIFAELDKLK